MHWKVWRKLTLVYRALLLMQALLKTFEIAYLRH
jgi:hypothetical protein